MARPSLETAEDIFIRLSAAIGTEQFPSDLEAKIRDGELMHLAEFSLRAARIWNETLKDYGPDCLPNKVT